MGEGRTAIVLKWAQYRIGTNLVAGRRQKATAVVTADVVALRGDRARVPNDIGALHTSLQDSIRDLERSSADKINATAVPVSAIAANRAVGNRQCPTSAIDAAAVATIFKDRRVTTDGAVADRARSTDNATARANRLVVGDSATGDRHWTPTEDAASSGAAVVVADRAVGDFQ